MRGRLTGSVLALVATSLAAHVAARSVGTDRAGLIGRVFYDRDDDGIWSPGDDGLGGVRLLTDSGLEVITAEDGRYHLFLLEAGWEIASGWLIVLDRASLPAGAVPRGSVRRLVELVPGEMARADFAVRPPAAEPQPKRGVAPATGRFSAMLEPAPDGRISTWLAGLAPSACAVRVAGQPVEVDEQGLFRTRVAIVPGTNPHLVSLHCDDGHLELLTVEIHWLTRRSGGDLVVPARSRSLVVCNGPPPGPLPRTRQIQLACRLEAGVDFQVDTDRGPDAKASRAETGRSADGRLRRYRLDVHPGDNQFAVRVRYGRERCSGRVAWRVAKTHWLGALYGNLGAAFAFDGESNSLHLGGRLRGYLEAALGWDLKLFLAGGLDSFEPLEGSVLHNVERALAPTRDPWRFERDPDPESAPVIHGDGARVIARNPTNSRYRFGLRRKESFVGYGGFVTGDDEPDGPGRFDRALFGAHAHLRPLEDWFSGPRPSLDLRLEGFAVRPDPVEAPRWRSSHPFGDGAHQLPAHEEFLATGSSLYFLGQRWVVEGSERLWVEQRDVRTGLAVNRRRLRRGVDYQVDWLAGRVLLTEPLASVPLTEGAVRLAPFGSTATVLVADYEYLSVEQGDYHESVTGAQLTLTGRPTSSLVLSGSLAAFGTARSAGEDYRLQRGRAQARVGRWLNVWAAWAGSRGRVLRPTYSVDGGLSLAAAPLPASGRDVGEAYEAGVDVSVGPVRGRFVFHRHLEGYADTSLLASGELTRFFAQARGDLARGFDLHGRFALTEVLSGRLLEGLVGLRVRPLEDLVLNLEGAYDEARPGGADEGFGDAFGDGQRALVGLRAAWRVLGRLSLTAGHQHNLWSEGQGRAGRDQTLSTAGVQWDLGEDLGLVLEGGWGPDVGNLLRLGLTQHDAGGRAVFAHTTFSVDRDALGPGGLTVGQVAPTEQGWVLTNSQTLVRGVDGLSAGQRLGLEIPIGRPWRVRLAYERAELHRGADAQLRRDLLPGPFFTQGLPGLSGPGRRNALFGRLAYVGRSFLISVSGEYRADEHLPAATDDWLHPVGPTALRQTVARLAARWRPTTGLTLGGRLAWAEAFRAMPGEDGPGQPAGRLLETSLGAMLRPADVNWLRLLVRFSAGSDRRPESDDELAWPNRGTETWALGSLAVILTPSRYVQPTLVVAPWLSVYQFPDDRETLRRSGVSGLLRLSSAVYAGLGLAGELRTSYGERSFDLFPEPGEPGWRQGLAVEVFYQLDSEDVGGLRTSLGYSFSDLPDLVMSDLHTGRRGLFFRLEGMLP